MDCLMLGFPVFHSLLEFAETHVHRVSNVIYPSPSLLSPCSLALNLSQHQSLQVIRKKIQKIAEKTLQWGAE